ncbi:hypothetical protein OG408_16505 [Streptomyces sp. NBC_01257]|nr:hypothetical protein [Streptomyces sp. RTGN2]WRZ65385.1 hypothetical protein OG408_16505 [Streptomyces sp. NBC_01257]
MSSYGSPSPSRSSSPSPTSASPPPPAPPPPCGVPLFPPLRVRGGSGHRLRRAVWRQRRAMAAGLALTAAALAASGLGGGGSGGDDGAGGGHGGAEATGAAAERASPQDRLVSAPVRIADAETVRLLRPGDRVDVVAAGTAGADGRVLAEGARVDRVPSAPAGASVESGALIVLSVPRSTAAALAGAGTSAGLAVILC